LSDLFSKFDDLIALRERLLSTASPIRSTW
jgi:hypothetical protein